MHEVHERNPLQLVTHPREFGDGLPAVHIAVDVSTRRRDRDEHGARRPWNCGTADILDPASDAARAGLDRLPEWAAFWQKYRGTRR
jgi:hypothetical protein